MELSVSLPTFLKINRGYTKYLLRESMRGTLPDNIIMRTDKMGFSTPESSYVKKYLYEIFNDELENINNTIPFINGHVIKDYFNLFLLGKKKYDRRFWRIVNYSIWSRLNNVSYG
jgi:Asparagine synthase (glutamine-hydrolyzing)